MSQKDYANMSGSELYEGILAELNISQDVKDLLLLSGLMNEFVAIQIESAMENNTLTGELARLFVYSFSLYLAQGDNNEL